MNIATIALGLLLTGAGFVALVRCVHDRTFHNVAAQFRSADGAVTAIGAFAALLAPIVSSIAAGVAFLAFGMLHEAAGLTPWLR